MSVLAGLKRMILHFVRYIHVADGAPLSGSDQQSKDHWDYEESKCWPAHGSFTPTCI
jgi:hypothetical protein